MKHNKHIVRLNNNNYLNLYINWNIKQKIFESNNEDLDIFLKYINVKRIETLEGI